MAIAYKSAGAGVATETSGAACSPACPAVVDAGDILIIHAYYEGTTTAPGTPNGFTLLHGPEVIQSTIGRHWIFGKIAAGTEDGAANAFGTAAVTTMRSGRCYSFSGRVSGTITDLVLGFAATSHANDPQMPTVTTTVAGALAVACVAQNDNNAQAAATGESGGDWVEAVAEFTAALTPGLALQLQTAAMANPGTISGGASATTNDPVGVIGFEIRPSVPSTVESGDIVSIAESTVTAAGASVASAAFSAAGESIATAEGAAIGGSSVESGDASMAGEATFTAEGAAIAAGDTFAASEADVQQAGAAIASADVAAAGESALNIEGASTASGDALAAGEATATIGAEYVGEEPEAPPATVSLSYGEMTSYIPSWARDRASERVAEDAYIADIIKLMAPRIAEEVRRRRTL